MAVPATERRTVFLNWLTMTTGQRIAAGWPDTRVELAEKLGCSDKTLQRLAERPDFQTELAERKRAVAAQLVPGLPPKAADEQSAALVSLSASGVAGETASEQMLALTFAKLGDLIAGGDRQAMDVFLRSPIAKAHMDAQLAAQRSDFRDLSTDELVAKTTELLTDAQLAATLTARGWTCTAPAALEVPA